MKGHQEERKTWTLSQGCDSPHPRAYIYSEQWCLSYRLLLIRGEWDTRSGCYRDPESCVPRTQPSVLNLAPSFFPLCDVEMDRKKMSDQSINIHIAWRVSRIRIRSTKSDSLDESFIHWHHKGKHLKISNTDLIATYLGSVYNIVEWKCQLCVCRDVLL